jgi:LytS/YehU family sensor histidine kinase
MVGAGLIALRAIAPAALLGLLVSRVTRRLAWPRPFRAWFVGAHLLAAGAYAVAWMLATSTIESVIRRHAALVVGPGIVPFLVLGVWLYVMVAGVSYATQATARAARAETVAAESRLAALRAQLHPHFLFNALHTVVQLIPREPARAAEATEAVAALLRTAIEEDRDLVTLAEEWRFVERYVEIEAIRFGDRLRVRTDIDDSARDALVPSFSLLTLVENAVRHGAAPRVDPTEVRVSASARAGTLIVSVHDTGSGPPGGMAEPGTGTGTGLARLRERLTALYGGAARLDLVAEGAGGFTASLTLPIQHDAFE